MYVPRWSFPLKREFPWRLRRRYSFLKLGNAAVRIQTIRSSFWSPLLSWFVGSSSQRSRVHARGRSKFSDRIVFKSPGGFRNLISLSDGHAMPVFSNGTKPRDNDSSLSVSLNREFAIAPQGTAGLPRAPTLKGMQSDDTSPLKSPSN